MIRRIVKDFKLTAGEYRDVPCAIPCSLVSVLEERGLIAPLHKKDNILRASELPSECEFAAVIELDERAAGRKHIYLKLDGVAASAEVIFNGKSYGFMKNPDREFVFNITDGVRAGENTLVIRAFEPMQRIVYFDGKKNSSPFVCDMGIVGKCTVLASDNPIIDSVRVVQKHDGDKVTLGIKINTLGAGAETRAVATLVSPIGRLYFAGISGGEGTVIVPDPELWYPNGYGSQSLYKLNVTLYNGDEAEDTVEVKVGLRNVRMLDDGIAFGGARISLKGADYQRDDVCVPIPSREHSAHVIEAVAECGMNMLHILDSGIHPDEHLYELCDKHGIIIVQQISLTYAPRTAITQYVERVKTEVPRMLDMLARHPSVCAVSFVPVYDSKIAVPETDGVKEEFIESCNRALEPIIREYESSFVFSEISGGAKNIVQLSASPALPPLRSICEFADEQDMNLLSPVMEAHTDIPTDASDMLVGLCAKYRYATEFSSLIYSSELSSAVDMMRAATAARISDPSASLILPLLNDSRPVISSSLIDHYGRRKAAYYLAKRFFSPVYVAASADGESIVFTVTNETDLPYSGMINYALYDDEDNCILESKRAALCNLKSSEEVIRDDLSRYMKRGKEHYYVIYDVFDGRSTSDKESVLFVPEKRFDFKNPMISAEVKGSGRNFDIVLSSSAFAKCVLVEFADVDAEFSANLIDVHRDYPVKLSFKTDKVTTAEHLRSVVRLRSVYDVGNN